MKKTYIHPTFEVIVLEQMCKQPLPTSNIPVVDDEEYVVPDEDTNGPGILSKPFEGTFWE